MHTFLIAHSADVLRTRRILDRTAHVLSRDVPAVFAKVDWAIGLSANGFTGWLAMQPKNSPPLLSDDASGRSVTLLLGRMAGVAKHEQAKLAGELYRCYGDLHTNDGIFAWASIDKASGKFHAGCDESGMLALLFSNNNGLTLVSPHDLCLLASGEIDCEVDLVQAYAMLCREWSPGGRSLVKGIKKLEPHQQIGADHGAVTLSQARRDFAPYSVERKQQKHDGLDSAARQLSDAFVNVVGTSMLPENAVNVTLSAGLDSRAVLAATLAGVPKEKIRIVSSGDPNSIDVSTARKISDIEGLRFHNPAHADPSADTLKKNAPLFAFATNGDLCESGQLALPIPESSEIRDQAVLFGTGGEVYRGNSRPLFPYKSLERARESSRPGHVSHDLIVESFEKKTKRFPYVNSDLYSAARDMVSELVQQLNEFSSEPAAQLDLYYFFERLGVWGNTKARQPWMNYSVPFATGRIFRLASYLQSTSSIGNVLQSELISRHLSSSLAIPINGDYFVSKQDVDLRRRVGLFWSSSKRRLNRRVSRSMVGIERRSAPAGKIEVSDVAARSFDAQLNSYVAELTGSVASLTRKLFGVSAEEVVINCDHKALVSLITMETWWLIAQAVSKRPNAS